MKFTFKLLPAPVYHLPTAANGKRKTALAFFAAICCIAFSNSVLAASPAKPAKPATAPGITISPASQLVNFQSTEALHQLFFKVTNNENTARTINVSTADFNTLDESGGLFFVGTNPTQLQKKYGLAAWLTIPQPVITVAPKQTISVEADIINQPSMAAGGHYGALMLSLASNSSGSNSQNKVAVQPIASSLLFVDKVGGDTHILKLTDVYATHSIFTLPSTVTLRFRNDGNTHLVPRGVVSITDSSGKLVSRGIINENSGIILPQSYRRYSVPLSKISSANLPGKYTLRVDFRFDGYNQFRTYQTSVFLLAPTTLIVFVVILVVTLGGILYLLRNHKAKRLFVKLLRR